MTTDLSKSKRWGEDGGLYVSEFEFRAAGDGNQFTGYAAVFNTPSDAPWLGFTETIRPGAFAESLRAKHEHTFVVNHDDNMLLASTRTGRLRLAEDSRGLLVNADLPKTSTASDLKALYEVGEVRGMSFTFKPTRGGVTPTPDGRELTNVRLGHVTVVTTLTPGYSATANTIQIRALADDLSAEADDLDDLLDGIRAGRPLVPNEVDLLERLAAHYRPATPPASEDRAAATEAFGKWTALLAEKGVISPSAQPGAEPGAA